MLFYLIFLCLFSINYFQVYQPPPHQQKYMEDPNGYLYPELTQSSNDGIDYRRHVKTAPSDEELTLHTFV